MINNRFNVVYHLLGLVKLLFYLCKKYIDMKEINLKIETKKVECETISIKTAIVVEEGTLEIVIPKKIRKEVEKLLIEELKNSKQ
jgi:hypothetical protein